MQHERLTLPSHQARFFRLFGEGLNLSTEFSTSVKTTFTSVTPIWQHLNQPTSYQILAGNTLSHFIHVSLADIIKQSISWLCNHFGLWCHCRNQSCTLSSSSRGKDMWKSWRWRSLLSLYPLIMKICWHSCMIKLSAFDGMYVLCILNLQNDNVC